MPTSVASLLPRLLRYWLRLLQEERLDRCHGQCFTSLASLLTGIHFIRELFVYVHCSDNALPLARNCVAKQLAHALRSDLYVRQSLQRELRPPLHPGLGLALVRGFLKGDALPVTAHRRWRD